MAIISVDFDHTMFNIDKPLPGLKNAINLLREQGHKIIVHSCNNVSWIKKCLNDHDIRYDYIFGETKLEGKKPVADLYVDDRGYRFPHNGDWSVEVDKILNVLKEEKS